jgi:large subunit ribosomal protein L4
MENFEKVRAIGLIHKVYLAKIKNSRKYTACTKTKSEVRGGGKKPWRQKGTGNARAGSSRSPLWVGGGVIFGPKPRIVNKKINKKERRLAVLSALYLKQKQIITIDEAFFNEFTTIKTKKIIEFLSSLGIHAGDRTLFVLTQSNKNFWISSRNIQNLEVTAATSLNIEQILNTNHIILSNTGLELITLTYGKS